VDADAAEEIAKLFVEAIAAPAFTPRPASASPPRRICAWLKSTPRRRAGRQARLRRIAAAGRRHRPRRRVELKVVTWRPPTAEELRSLLFAWRVCKHVKSNAIVYARDGQTLGVGAGQMSRVDAARFGAMKAVLPLKGCVAASDAFFPFPDGLEAVAAGRSHRRHPARRLGKGSGRNRRRRQAGHGHGLHRHPPLPALTAQAIEPESEEVVLNLARLYAESGDLACRQGD
jgi:hypothetical protein